MKTKKLILFLSVTLVMTLSFSGCFDSDEESAKVNMTVNLINAAEGAKLYFSIIDGDTSDVTIMNQQAEYLGQNIVTAGSDGTGSAITLEMDRENEAEFTDGKMYKVAVLLDIDGIGYDLTTGTGMETGDKYGLKEVTLDGNTTVTFDVNSSDDFPQTQG